MRYDKRYCFWCKKDLENKEAIYSLGTDTLQTERNFCNHKCMKAFKDYFQYQGIGKFNKKPIIPYKGGK